MSADTAAHLAHAPSPGQRERMAADEGVAGLDALSPFELQDELAQRAARSGAPRVLDAGKGQPNWLATTPATRSTCWAGSR